MPYTTDEKVAVVTGAGRGIGRALVDVLSKNGYRVVGVVRSLDHEFELRQLRNVTPVCCDVREPSTEDTLREFLDRHVPHVDLLVNNAGFGAKHFGILGLDYKEFEDVLSVNCYGPIRITRACLAHLRRSSAPVIVNMSSRFASNEWVSQKIVPHDQATYAYRIAKAALNMLSSCLAVELESDSIRVLAVDPGKVKTRFGPRDADVEPVQAAEAILQLVQSKSQSGTFVHASGEKLPW